MTDILKPIEDSFSAMIDKIDRDLERLARELNTVDTKVDRDLDDLLQQYKKQIEESGASPDEIRKRYRGSLMKKRIESLTEKQRRLEELREQVLTLAPSQVSKQSEVVRI